ncbi:MAG: hypothetical protein JRG81_07145 [Deltaproteobacteria bacterium]|nr:hypothetical protein [Deltaproteobacteria bacterium]
MNRPEATQAALDILRTGEHFQWYVITLLALVLYVYLNEISKKNWWLKSSTRLFSISAGTRCGPLQQAPHF